MGKETIDTYNTGESRGRETSHSLNYQKLGKELMSQDELAVMDGGKCILQLRGVRPFLSDKFDITKHPNYKYLSDYDKKNAFNIERFLSARLKLRPDEQFAAYSIDLSGTRPPRKPAADLLRGKCVPSGINQKSINFYGGTLWNFSTLLWMFFRLS